jgi:hypothetical protein
VYGLCVSAGLISRIKPSCTARLCALNIGAQVDVGLW